MVHLFFPLDVSDPQGGTLTIQRTFVLEYQ